MGGSRVKNELSTLWKMSLDGEDLNALMISHEGLVDKVDHLSRERRSRLPALARRDLTSDQEPSSNHHAGHLGSDKRRN